MATAYHAKYFAHELTRLGGDGLDRLGRSLFDACVELNPHQIDAAMFALRSPLSKGVILADEVGLGKTIEAGLVICQHWAERRRRILVLTPASLRKQWEQELKDKFNLPARVLDAKTYKQLRSAGEPNPFMLDEIVICSTHFASSRATEIQPMQWDLVVIDEAHKLRNAYRQSNRMGQNIRWALEDRRKLLLTATPLQNSLLELYGLANLIDERIFGDLPSFRTRYTGSGGDLDGLRDRLAAFCKRTLRRDVLEYVKYTNRKLFTQPFKPSDQEQALYDALSEFLHREDAYALPVRQRHLITLLVRKVMASSAHAVAGTLTIMRDRLREIHTEALAHPTLTQFVLDDLPLDDDLLDEILEDAEDSDDESEDTDNLEVTERPIDLKRLAGEITELDQYIRWAHGIGIDTKSRALLTALGVGFEQMAEMGARRKAVVFTESRRTQAFLQDFLEANGYAGKVLAFNGTNRGADVTRIYDDWLETNRDSGRLSGSRAIDVRTAIIEAFRDTHDILIATEAAAEGINLQFCSLLINYDLPWNPQRVEQRIGRCHRYGQEHDVVVINFLNERNDADRRVHELLETKFSLFSGVFGASDEVLGAIESGVDFERRIMDIYQQCRTQEQIQAAFDALQAELDETIQTRIQDTRKILLEHFDESVHDRLKINLTSTRERLDVIGSMFWTLTRYVLEDVADFHEADLSFTLRTSPVAGVRPGRYRLISKAPDADNDPGEFLYRLGHPLGEHVLASGAALEPPVAHVTFDITNHPVRIAVIEQLRGQSGYLLLQRLRVESFEHEDYLLFTAYTDAGTPVDPEVAARLFTCQANVSTGSTLPQAARDRLAADAEQHVRATINRSLETNNHHFRHACAELDKWAEDMEISAGRELEDAKAQITALRRQIRQATTMDEQHTLQAELKKLETHKRRLRQRIYDVEDEIADKRDTLIQRLEQRMQQKTQTTPLFTIRWSVV